MSERIDDITLGDSDQVCVTRSAVVSSRGRTCGWRWRVGENWFRSVRATRQTVGVGWVGVERENHDSG